MFAVLIVSPTGKKKIKRGRGIGEIKEHSLPKGRFYTVELFDSKRGVRLDDAANFLGKYKNRVVTDNHLIIPNDSDIIPLSLDNFFNTLLINTACNILSQAHSGGECLRCVITDKYGKYISKLSMLSKYAEHLTVITDNDEYKAKADAIYRQTGATIAITRRLNKPWEGLIVDTDCISDCEMALSKNAIRPFCVNFYDNIKALCPKNVDEMMFLAAVFEFCPGNGLEEAACSLLQYKDKIMTPFSLISQISTIKAI